jgi:ubiquinone/menaquinone biosynthesis C-methylase UbiE
VNLIGRDREVAALSRLLDRAAQGTGDGTTRFLTGRAEELPLGDAEADVALPVFGLIFAADAETAAAELSRVLGGRGRIVLSAWIPAARCSSTCRSRRRRSGERSVRRPRRRRSGGRTTRR